MTIRTGIGGWTFAPWRGVFYPQGLAQARELEYASRQLTSIEINGTFYGSQKPESYRKWREETPDGFVFALKGPRFAVNRRELATAGESLIAGVRQAVFSRTLPLASQDLRVTVTKAGGLGGAIGAARLVLDQVLNPEAVNRRLGDR